MDKIECDRVYFGDESTETRKPKAMRISLQRRKNGVLQFDANKPIDISLGETVRVYINRYQVQRIQIINGEYHVKMGII